MATLASLYKQMNFSTEWDEIVVKNECQNLSEDLVTSVVVNRLKNLADCILTTNCRICAQWSEHFSPEAKRPKSSAVPQTSSESRANDASAKWHERCGRRPFAGISLSLWRSFFSGFASRSRLAAGLASSWTPAVHDRQWATPLNALGHKLPFTLDLAYAPLKNGNFTAGGI